MFNCSQCDTVLENEVDLEDHLKAIHINDSQQQQSRQSKRKLTSTENIPPKKAKTDVAGFVCDSCQKSFTRKDNLTQHIRKFHKDNYDISQKTSNISNFHCSSCDKSFTRKDNLKTHMKKFHE